MVWSATKRDTFINVNTDASGLRPDAGVSGRRYAEHKAALVSEVKVACRLLLSGFGGNPESQVPALFKTSFILRPVGDGVFCFRNMMTLPAVVFMRHC